MKKIISIIILALSCYTFSFAQNKIHKVRYPNNRVKGVEFDNKTYYDIIEQNPFDLNIPIYRQRKFSNVLSYKLESVSVNDLDSLVPGIKWRQEVIDNDISPGFIKIIPSYKVTDSFFVVDYTLIAYTKWDEYIGCDCNISVFNSVGTQIFTRSSLSFDCNETEISDNGKYLMIKYGGDYDEPTKPFLAEGYVVYDIQKNKLIDSYTIKDTNNSYPYLTGVGKEGSLVYTKIKLPQTDLVTILIYNSDVEKKYTIQITETDNKRIKTIKETGIVFGDKNRWDKNTYTYKYDSRFKEEDLK